jgi:16S rRNA (cytosine967-C5)-methyltransferase
MNPSSDKKFDIASKKGLAARYLAFKSLKDLSLKMLPTDRLWLIAEKYNVPIRERSFAYDLLSGTIKRRATLDFFIEKFSKRRAQQIDSDVLDILRFGFYQLLYEDSVPDFAAVDTSCELAHLIIGKKPVGFVNAVLRNFQREATGQNRSDMVTISLSNITDYYKSMEIYYSYPVWLIKRWLGRWDEGTVREILEAGNCRPAMTVRPNLLRISGEKLAVILAEQGCEVKTRENGMLELVSHPPISELKAFADGLFQVQDTTAGEVVQKMELKAGMKILDLCAGLGTKTTQLAECLGDRAEITASDTIISKFSKLEKNAERLGIKSIRTSKINDLSAAMFDWVLLDVPCSNTGVFDRRPEARWRLKESDFTTYSKQSIELLNQAEKLLNANGRIAFSTCSIDEEEDERVISKFCESNNWQIAKEHLQLPKIDAESHRTVRTGGYWAILER